MTTALETQIRSQPEALGRMVAVDITEAAKSVATWQRLWLIGTGTSEHAAMIGARMFQDAGVDAHAIPAMHFACWPPQLRPGDAAVVITHTAETAYALAARERALAAGMSVLPITRIGGGLPDSIETVEKETSETYTVSYTTTLLLLARLAGSLGSSVFTDEAIARVPDAARAALADSGVGGIEQPQRLLVLTGAGIAAASAREGALKLREAARFPAEAYDAEFLLHGNAVPLTGADHLVILTPPQDDNGFLSGVARVADAAGLPVTRVAEPADLPPPLAQIPLTVRLQLLALRFSEERGQDPDTVITGAWDDATLWGLGSP